MDPVIVSTLQTGHGVFLLSCYRWVAPFPALRRPNASSDISDLIAPVWYVIVLNFLTLAVNTIL